VNGFLTRQNSGERSPKKDIHQPQILDELREPSNLDFANLSVDGISKESCSFTMADTADPENVNHVNRRCLGFYVPVMDWPEAPTRYQRSKEYTRMDSGSTPGHSLHKWTSLLSTTICCQSRSHYHLLSSNFESLLFQILKKFLARYQRYTKLFNLIHSFVISPYFIVNLNSFLQAAQ
jgi:hypothetical protein